LGYRFFFVQTRKQINEQYPNLSKGGNDAKANAAAKGTIDGYGWLNSIYPTAQDGIFNLPDQNPLNSVLLTDLYEVLTYLSWKSACVQYEKTYSKLIQK
jgi:hypothetical protein